MAKKMGLGRGLSAILPDVEEVVESVDQVSESAAPVPADAVAEIPVGDIDPNRNQPRKKFDDDALLALAAAEAMRLKAATMAFAPLSAAAVIRLHAVSASIAIVA